jgi:hypothetical protein
MLHDDLSILHTVFGGKDVVITSWNTWLCLFLKAIGEYYEDTNNNDKPDHVGKHNKKRRRIGNVKLKFHSHHTSN